MERSARQGERDHHTPRILDTPSLDGVLRSAHSGVSDAL